MEDSSPLQSSTLNPSETTHSFSSHRRRPLHSRTLGGLLRIFSICRPQLQLQEPVTAEDGSVTLSEAILTDVLVQHPKIKGSEDKVVRETSDSESKENTDFDGKQATTPNLHQPELVKGGEQELTPSNEISVEDYFVTEEHMDDFALQNTKELENANSVFNIQMDDFGTLKDVRMDKDSTFHHLNEALDSCFVSDMIIESSEGRQLSQEKGTVLEENVLNDVVYELKTKERDDFGTLKDVGLNKDSSFHHLNEALDSCFVSDMIVESSEDRQLSQEKGTILEENVLKDVVYELKMKEMELEKLINSSGDTEAPCSQNDGEIEEGEISGDDVVADESFDALSENLHASEGNFDSDKLLCEDKDRGRQQHSDPLLVNIVKSRTPAGQLQGYCSQDFPRGNHTETPKNSDMLHCLDNRTPPGRILQANAAENEIYMTTEEDKNADKKKRKRGMTKERRAKKKRKERIKRAEERGSKRLKIQTKEMKKKIEYCRHYLQGRCHEGENCKFSHDTVPLTKSKPCGHLARDGCMKGDNCPYDHELSKYPCNNFTLTGSCHRGSKCLFSHETQTVAENKGSHPISKANTTSDLKSPSPLKNPSSSRPMDSCGISHQRVNSRLCSAAANSPVQREEALKRVPRTGGQAPKGVSFVSNGALLVGDTDKDKQDRSTDGGVGGMNEMDQGVVAPRKPRGINFLSFGRPPSDDSSNKMWCDLVSSCNGGNEKEGNGTSLKGDNLLSSKSNTSHSDVSSTSKEKDSLDSSSKSVTVLSFPSPSPTFGRWNANLCSSSVQSTLAFAAQLEPDIKLGSSHHHLQS